MSRLSSTDAPFATAQKAGRKMTYHYTLEGALTAAKVSNKYRIVQGIHRGEWITLCHFDKGERVCRQNQK